MHAGSEWQLVKIGSSREGGQHETGEHRRETEALQGDKVIGGQKKPQLGVMLGIDGEENGLKKDAEEVNKDKRLPDLKTSHFLFCFSHYLPGAHMNLPDTASKSEHLTSVRNNKCMLVTIRLPRIHPLMCPDGET